MFIYLDFIANRSSIQYKTEERASNSTLHTGTVGISVMEIAGMIVRGQPKPANPFYFYFSNIVDN